jgi:tyrosine-protein kinase Etk/Wzc
MTKLHSGGSPQEMERDTPTSPASYVVEDELTFLDFLIIVSQRKKLIAIVTAICALSALLIASLLPVEYTATAIILPSQGNSSMSNMLATQLAGMGSVSGIASSALGLKNLDEMYVSMLKSRSVEDAVIKRYGLMAEYHKDYLVQARKELEKHAKIEGSTKDGLIRLNFSDRNPSRAAEIANGYVEQFRSLSHTLR